MKLYFSKYHGTANDFVMIDNRSGNVNLTNEQIKKMCDRRTGIGADGLILIQKHEEYDFQMIYYNADGRESTMCGNGGRCIVAFAHSLSVIGNKTTFLAVDGIHHAEVLENGSIALEMIPVDEIMRSDEDFLLNTGSPHYVQFCNDLINKNVFEDGSYIRNSIRFVQEGINVNFVEIIDDVLHIRTFERGVEDETWSCGTGVVASSIAYAKKKDFVGHQEIKISTRGGRLKVTFDNSDGDVNNIWLVGPTICVYEGEMDI